MAGELKNGPKAKGADRIFLHGEMEWEKWEKACLSGELELSDVIVNSLKQLSETNGVELRVIG